MGRGSRDGPAAGGAQRALLWLLGGLLLAVLAGVAIAPELLADPRAVGVLVLLATAAGLPGLAIVLVLAVRRRAEQDEDEPPATGEPADNGHRNRSG